MCTALVANAQVQKEQLFVTKDNIKSIDSFGDYEKINPEYSNFYNASNLFDGKQNSYSFFSEYGPSGFEVELNNPLPKPVCSIEIGVFNPQNTDFSFKLNDRTMNGNLNGAVIEGDLNPCVEDLQDIQMDFTGVNATGAKKWTTLSEVKLFTNDTIIIEPPICGPGTHLENGVCVPDVVNPPPTQGNVTFVNIENTTAFMNVTDSTLVINIDDETDITTNITETDNDNDEEEEEEDKDNKEDDN